MRIAAIVLFGLIASNAGAQTVRVYVQGREVTPRYVVPVQTVPIEIPVEPAPIQIPIEIPINLPDPPDPPIVIVRPVCPLAWLVGRIIENRRVIRTYRGRAHYPLW